MSESQSQENGATSKRLPEWHSWPNAAATARRLGCARAHVYRLEGRGQLRSVEVTERGRRVRKYDPITIEAVKERQSLPVDELEAGELDAAGDDDGSDGGGSDDESSAMVRTGGGGDVYRLLARLLSEAREITKDARKGQHDAYQLIATPSRELHVLMSEALKQAYERIRELEKVVSAMHDEQRDSRREDREFALFEKQVSDGEARKEQFMKLFLENAPVVFGQVLETVKGPGGPLAEWLRAKSPDQQKKYITALETFVSVADDGGGGDGTNGNTA